MAPVSVVNPEDAMSYVGKRAPGQWMYIAAACFLALGGASLACAGEAGPRGLAALEEVFWACDYIGTTQGVAEAPVQLCVEATQTLEHEKFGGDFDAMVEWWRRNKPAEHAKVAAQDPSAAPAVQRDVHSA